MGLLVSEFILPSWLLLKYVNLLILFDSQTLLHAILHRGKAWEQGNSYVYIYCKPSLIPRLQFWPLKVAWVWTIPSHSFSSISLVPRPSITANVVEGLVKLLRRMTLGRRWEAWLIALCMTSTAVYRKYHTSQCLPNVILHRSSTRPSTALAVIEGLGTWLQ